MFYGAGRRKARLDIRYLFLQLATTFDDLLGHLHAAVRFLLCQVLEACNFFASLFFPAKLPVGGSEQIVN